MPTDLFALAVASGRTYRNEAVTRERLGRHDCGVRPLGPAVEPWLSLRKERSVWIASRRQMLQGLVSARAGGTRQAWEIDCVIDATQRGDVLPGLLEKAISDTGRQGAQKLFLRLPATSRLVALVRAAGFVPYIEETVYERDGGPFLARPDTDARPLSRLDLYPWFRLYNQVTPEQVRRGEGLTFGEWQASLSRHWLREGREMVVEGEAGLEAVLRFARVNEDLLFDIQARPEGLDRVKGLVALASTAGGARMLTLVPDYAEGLARRLEEIDFRPGAQIIAFYHRTVRPVRAGKKLVPAVANTAAAP
jgi:hypothetical protein